MASKRSDWKKALLQNVAKQKPQKQPALPQKTSSGTEKVQSWLDNAQYEESECPPLSVSGTVINDLFANVLGTKAEVPPPPDDGTVDTVRPSSTNYCALQVLAPNTSVAIGNDQEIPPEAPNTNLSPKCAESLGLKSLGDTVSVPVSQVSSESKVIPYSAAQVDTISSVTEKEILNEVPNSNLLPQHSESYEVERFDLSVSTHLREVLISPEATLHSCVERDICVTDNGIPSSDLPNSTLSPNRFGSHEFRSPHTDGKIVLPSNLSPESLCSPANKILAVSGVEGAAAAIMKKDGSITNPVRRKLAFPNSCCQTSDLDQNIPTIPSSQPPSQLAITCNQTREELGVKRKMTNTPEKLKFPKTAADELYVNVEKRSVLHACAGKASAAMHGAGSTISGKSGMSTTEHITLTKTFNSAFSKMTIENSKERSSSCSAADLPCGMPVTNTRDMGTSLSPTADEESLVTTSIENSSVVTSLQTRAAPTPMPRSRVVTPLPSPRVRADSPLPKPRTLSAVPLPMPRTTALTPPLPTPRRSILTPSPPSPHAHPSSLLDVNNNMQNTTPESVKLSSTCADFTDKGDETTGPLTVLNMEELDPELQKLLTDSAFNSPAALPIIFPTPPGSGTSAIGEVIYCPGMAIVAATPSKDVNPNTPPETPEAEISIDMDIEIPDNFIDGLEELLAEPLGENLDGIFDIDEEDNALPEKETFRKKEKKLSKQDIAKEAHNKGLEHLNVKGNLIKAREMRPACENCRFKCSEKLPQDQRESIFKKYWALGNKQQQDGFIRENITIKEPEWHMSGADVNHKNHTVKYSFKFPTGQIVVCKTMFLNTLGVSESPVRTYIKKLERGITTTSPDKRGRHAKVDPAVKKSNDENIMEHIRLFKTVPSHFCRMRSKRKYLSPSLTIRHMWRLYKKWMEENKPEEQIKAEKYYRKIFCSKFNLGFHKPKKDRCDLCLVYEIGTAGQKKRLQAKFDEHIRNKRNAKAARIKDAEYARSCPDTACYCLMDLQQVISLPKTEAGMVFYKRKLSAYNFTIYDKIQKKGYCYVWNESEAKRGANEIASCVRLFIIKKASEGITDFFFWSDNCSGQNKNKYLFAVYTWASVQFGVKITHRYMEKGHTMNEADSMHSTIEKAARYEQIFVPEDLLPIIQNAKRKGKKYDVKFVGSEILDCHPLADTLQNWINKKAKWKHVREIVVDADKPGAVYVRHDLTAPDPVEIKITKVGGQVNLALYSFPKAYNGPLQLKANKLKDLATLCSELVIPSYKHAFYLELLNFPPLGNPFGFESENEEESEDDEARLVAEKDFVFDYDNDEDTAESDYEEELRIAKETVKALSNEKSANNKSDEEDDEGDGGDDPQEANSEAGNESANSNKSSDASDS